MYGTDPNYDTNTVDFVSVTTWTDCKTNRVTYDNISAVCRYQNAVAVDKRVYKNVKLFMENKKEGDDLFDRLNTTILNQYLTSLMDGLTAKVLYVLTCPGVPFV